MWSVLTSWICCRCPPSVTDSRDLAVCSAPGAELLRPRSSLPALAGPWPAFRGPESKKLNDSVAVINLESRALETPPVSFLPEPRSEEFRSRRRELQHRCIASLCLSLPETQKCCVGAQWCFLLVYFGSLSLRDPGSG